MSKIFYKLFDYKEGRYYPNWEYIETIPEFAVLKETKQSDRWHKEGTAWIHTQNVVNEMLKLCDNCCMPDVILTAALFHDIGKGVSTFQGKDGRWHSYGHEETGERITRRLLWDEGYEFREAVCCLVRYHMEPLKIFESKAPLERIAYLQKELSENGLCFGDLIDLKRCDVRGSIMEDDTVKESNEKELNELETIDSSFDCFMSLYDCINSRKRESVVIKDKRKPINVFFMIGLPGAGKDTFLSRFRGIKQGNGLMIPEDAVIASRDEIRTKLGYCGAEDKIIGTAEQEEKVSEVFDNMILSAAKQGRDIVINNLNIKKKYREAIIRSLSNYRVNVYYIYIEAPSLADNIERREGYIDERGFYGIIDRIEWPTVNEYDRFLKFKNS